MSLTFPICFFSPLYSKEQSKKQIESVIEFERLLAQITAREDNMTGMFVTLEKVRPETNIISPQLDERNS